MPVDAPSYTSTGMVHILPGTYAECVFSMMLLVLHLTLLSYIIGQVSNNVMNSEEEVCVPHSPP
jgi:hypothetical protein